MAVHVFRHHPVDSAGGTVTEVRSTDSSGRNIAARVLALVAAAVPTIVGLIALARISWGDQGLDAPAVSVAGMTFSPWIAIATLVAGLIGLGAAATWDRESKFGVGAIMVCGGIAIVAANPVVQQVTLTDRMGAMYILVGAVLVVAGLLAGRGWSTRRRVDRY
jgi:hypothetical protein